MKNFADLHLRAVRGALMLLWVGLLVACASNSGKFLPAPASAGTQNYSYIVGLGDDINIIVWR